MPRELGEFLLPYEAVETFAVGGLAAVLPYAAGVLLHGVG
jgi:hypothetical protein